MKLSCKKIKSHTCLKIQYSSLHYELKTHENPVNLFHGKFTGFSKDFNGIFMGNLTRFFMARHPGKSMKKKKH